MQFTCPQCKHIGADSNILKNNPLCDKCDYKFEMLPSHNGKILPLKVRKEIIRNKK